MKKILSFVMVVAMALSLSAFAPMTTKKVAHKAMPRIEQKAPVAPAAQSARLATPQARKAMATATALQTKKQQPQVKHVAKKNIVRKAGIKKAAMETTATFTFASDNDVNQTVSNVTLAIEKAGGQSDPAWNDNSKHLRVYANNTITISGSGITKIELTCGKTNKAYASLTANTGSLVSGGESTAVGDFKTDTWTGTANEVVFTVGTGQRAVEKIVVTVGGEVPPTPPTPSGDVTITGLNYADAVFYADETYGDYWVFDFYKELDEEGYILSPYVYFICEESTTSGTKIAGTWTAYESAYFATDDEESGIYTDEENPVGSLTVTCVSQGVYNFVGSFVGEDGKTYTWTLNNMEVYAYNGDTYEDITLTDGGEPTPVGDTIPLTSLDGLDIAYYGSYSEEGAYNYTLVLYNSQDESYVPQVGFDIYTEVKDEFTGDFTAEDGNLGLDYSAFYPTADSEGEYFTDASVSITKGEGNNLVVEGIFTTEAGKTYTFSVTAEPYIYDGDHPYEPQEAKTFNLTAIGGEVDDSYFADYGIVYYYLDMEDGSYVGLTYRTSKGTQPEGTFAISDEEGADAFLTGMDYNSEPDGSFYETIDGYVYYFVSGSVTLTTDEDGNITITINATSVYGSTFTVTGVISNQSTGDPIIISDDYLRLNDSVKKFMYKGNVVIRKSGKNYNVLGAEL